MGKESNKLGIAKAATKGKEFGSSPHQRLNQERKRQVVKQNNDNCHIDKRQKQKEQRNAIFSRLSRTKIFASH